MQALYQILGLLGAALIVWITYRNIKGRPDVFSKENTNKSLYTMGILALVLIVFIAVLVLLLRS